MSQSGHFVPSDIDVETVDQQDDNPKLLSLAILVAAGNSRGAIAEELGISTRTLNRWRQLPWVRAQINQILSSARESAAARVRIIAPTALLELERMALDPDTNPRVKADILFKLLDLGMTLTTSLDSGLTDPEQIKQKDLERANLQTIWD